MLTIAIDVDGVVLDIITPWLSVYNQEYNDILTRDDITDWDIHKLVKPRCGGEIYKYLDLEKTYFQANVDPDAKLIINAFRDLGHRIVFVTSTTPKSMGVKYRKLLSEGLIDKRENYIECADKSLIRASVLLDDYPKNLENFQGARYLYSQPWNKDETKYAGYARVGSFIEFYNEYWEFGRLKWKTIT